MKEKNIRNFLNLVYIENKDNVVGGFLYGFFTELKYIYFKMPEIREKINKIFNVNFNLNENDRYTMIEELFIDENINEKSMNEYIRNEIKSLQKIYYLIFFSDNKTKLSYLFNFMLNAIQRILSGERQLIVVEILKKEYEKARLSLTSVNEDVSYEAIKENNEFIKLNKFSFLYENNISSLGNQIVLTARFGVGKTIASLNIIEDVINSNDKDKYVILYFGTSEVNKQNFYKRFLTMKSSYNINGYFKKLYDLQEKLKSLKELDLENTIQIQDSKLQVQKIFNKIDENKFSSHIYDLSSLFDKYTRTSERIKRINNGEEKTNHPLKSYLEHLKSELDSLFITIKELVYNTLYNFIKDRKDLFEFIFSVIDENKLNKFNIEDYKKIKDLKQELYKAKELFSDNTSNTDIVNEVLKEYGEEQNKKTISIKEILNVCKNNKNIKNKNIFYIIDFLIEVMFVFHLIKNNENIFLDDFTTISKNIKAIIEDLENNIFKIDNLLREEYNSVKTYIENNNIEIYNDLHIEFIDEKMEEAKMKYPDKKLIYIIDYHNSVITNQAKEEKDLSLFVGEKALEYSDKYNSFGVIFSQLNKVGKENVPVTYRPGQAEIRGGEGIAHKVGSVGIIFNRDMFANKGDIKEEVDRNFVIYEIYLTKNRYGRAGLNTTKYYILDKMKMKYIPINENVYSVLEEDKEIKYLDELRDKLRKKYTGLQNVDNLIFN